VDDNQKHKLPADNSAEAMQTYLSQLDIEVASIKANLHLDHTLYGDAKGKKVERRFATDIFLVFDPVPVHEPHPFLFDFFFFTTSNTVTAIHPAGLSERPAIGKTRSETTIKHSSHLGSGRQEEGWGISFGKVFEAIDPDKWNIENQRKRMEEKDEEMFDL